MSKRKAARKTPASPVISRANALADAALIGALFTVLAFQEIRFEGYETEKSALLVIFAAVILAVRALNFILGHSDSGDLYRPLWNPVKLGVIVLLAAGALSMLFSLSAQRSLWGSPDRAQGFLSMCVYALLFMQAAQTGRRLLPMLLPVLVTIAAPLCGFAFIARFGLDVARPGSTTGNGNYLSAWLVLAVIIIAAYLLIYARHWQWTTTQRVAAGALIGTMFMMLVTVGLAGSRGALVALAFGMLTLAFLGAALTQNRRVMALVAGFVLIAGGIYGGISTSIDTANLSVLSSTERLFVPYDRFRLVAWDGAAGVLANSADPLQTANGEPDAFAGLRRAIGYGPDTVAQLQSRFELASSERTYANSFHNHIFDTLVMLGYPGLIAWVLIYGGAAYIALRALGLLPPGRWPLWVAVETGGAALGVLILTLVFDDASTGAILPLGAALGGVGGLLAWLALMTTRSGAEITLTDRHLFIAALLAVMVVRWVDNQFGFSQAASDPLWWALLGLLVALCRDTPESDDPLPAPPAHYWHIAGACAALMLTLGFGSGINSEFIVQSLAQTEGYILAVLALGVGTLGALLTGHVDLRWFAAGIVLWGMALGVKALANSIAGSAFDTALNNAGQIDIVFLLIGIKGITVSVGVITLWALRDGPPHLMPAYALLIVVALAGSAGYYTLNHAGGVLHNLANSLSSTEDTAFIRAADVPYAQATDYLQSDGRARLDRGYNLLKYPDPPLTAIDDQLDALFASNPFHIHTLEWDIFADAYGRITGQALPNP